MDSRTHIIPRADVKGQDRFFIFFSVPGLIGTVIGIAIGYPLFAIVSAISSTTPGLVVLALCGLVGFAIGQGKIPDTNAFPLFKNVGGEYVRDIIVRYFKFRKTKKKFANQISSKQEFTVNEESKLEKIVMNKE